MPKTYLLCLIYTDIVSADLSAETDIRAFDLLVLNLDDFFAVLLSALRANSVVEIVCTAVGALLKSGLGQFPYAGTSGILSCF